MFIITILFSGLFLQDSFAFIQFEDYKGDMDPKVEWSQKYQKEFDRLDLANFSLIAAHILHGLTVEDAMTSLDIMVPINNGIPCGNSDLSADESSAVLANIPSRPSEYSSAGLHGFVDFMDHVTNPDWQVRGEKLLRLFHVFHMHESWAMARKAAGGFSGVSDNICIGALDHANNGIEKAITVIFNAFKRDYLKDAFDKPFTWDDNGESWAKRKEALGPPSNMMTNSMGLYTQCLMRKFRQTEQPIGLDSCCESKTVGDYTYTLISAGKVLSRCPDSCIYTRKDQNGSQYCFAKGDLKVQCLR